MLEARAENEQIERDNHIYYAWLGSHLNAFSYHDPKHFPDLEDYLPKKVEVVEDTPEEHRERCLQRGTKPPPR